MSSSVYQWLMGKGGDAALFDRHLFACCLALVAAESRPLTVSLGLSPHALRCLLERYFPHAAGLAADLAADGDEPLAPEEPDLRAYLQEHGSRGAVEETWLAHIIARRALESNHLWQDLGLVGRADLSVLMARHFAPLATANWMDMKWKKFFYRELCKRDGLVACKAPVCDICEDFLECFGGEQGQPLTALAGLRP
ncbi:MAG TPA: nitrogen fixation protein NifQ [Rhodospirillaceae bacterium]|nr:nitrogen fixation protein NifQ [Rhodospirillaceae bacterium]